MRMTRREFGKRSLKYIAVGAFIGATASCPIYEEVKTDDVRLSYNSDSEFRELPVRFFYPKHWSESLSLIGFSHGFSASPNVYDVLLREIALSGYLVVAPQHNDYINFLPSGGIVSVNLPRFIDDAEEVLGEIHNVDGFVDYSYSETWDLFFGGVINGSISDVEIVNI